MSLVSVLKDVKDFRAGAKECEFNGYLEDYLNVENHPHDALYQSIAAMDDSCRIMINFSVFINKDLIANKIISYKDIFKIPKWYIKAPVILYSQGDDHEFAILLVDRNYLEAKGIFYCLTEQGALLERYRNNVLVLTFDDETTVVELYRLMLEKGNIAPVLQREQDRRRIGSIENLGEVAVATSRERVETLRESFEIEPSGRATRIHEAIASWYLIKKMVYVHTMLDRESLNTASGGDIKVQRQKAKELSSRVEFIPFSEMWRQ
ncbi:hypothetical protein G7062_01430 [Erysipelothrix sp. HDW6C]|uniref:hypothetical protein n=1 Tax=Erysipelothrix sp. HDW6C TaxID=2714930 RepID=UPI00140A252E|nr:hypothetical protein [Erysipelothrix sp. HDW6C]QIK69024.1 hypothetical protein G7062_01430 [Erysipelothrix sp. HDW6C]